MDVECRYLRPTAVAFVRETGPYAESSRAAWARMFAWLDEAGARSSIRRGIGYIRDNPAEVGPFLRRYDACVELPPGVRPSPAHGVGRLMLPGGAYAVYRHTGSHDGLPRTFSLLHRQWLIDQGFEIDRDRAFMEVYLDDPAVTAAAGLRTELCVPVVVQGQALRATAG